MFCAPAHMQGSAFGVIRRVHDDVAMIFNGKNPVMEVCYRHRMDLRNLAANPGMLTDLSELRRLDNILKSDNKPPT